MPLAVLVFGPVRGSQHQWRVEATSVVGSRRGAASGVASAAKEKSYPCGAPHRFKVPAGSKVCSGAGNSMLHEYGDAHLLRSSVGRSPAGGHREERSEGGRGRNGCWGRQTEQVTGEDQGGHTQGYNGHRKKKRELLGGKSRSRQPVCSSVNHSTHPDLRRRWQRREFEAGRSHPKPRNGARIEALRVAKEGGHAQGFNGHRNSKFAHLCS